MNKDEIMKQFDSAMKNLKEWVEDKPKEKPEWEERFQALSDKHEMRIKINATWGAWNGHQLIIDFIRQEFVKMGQEIIQPDNGIIELSAYPAEAYRQGIYDMKYKVNEALRKRGVK